MNADRIVRAFAAQMTTEGRTVIGLAAPFNRVAEVADPPHYRPYRESILPGAFARTITERGPARVKFLINHDRLSSPIGRALMLREAADGLHVELGVSRTRAGDEALELIRDRALDGLSISGRVVTSRRAGDVTQRAEIALREISATAFPAYEDAVVSAVRSATLTHPCLDHARRRTAALRATYGRHLP